MSSIEEVVSQALRLTLDIILHRNDNDRMDDADVNDSDLSHWVRIPQVSAPPPPPDLIEPQALTQVRDLLIEAINTYVETRLSPQRPPISCFPGSILSSIARFAYANAPQDPTRWPVSRVSKAWRRAVLHGPTDQLPGGSIENHPSPLGPEDLGFHNLALDCPAISLPGESQTITHDEASMRTTTSKSPKPSKKRKRTLKPEEGWDHATKEVGVVLDYETKAEVRRRIALSSAVVPSRPSYRLENIGFDKLFGDEDYIAAGILVIFAGKEKSRKCVKDNTYVYYCMEGVVQVNIHTNDFVIAPGGVFMVPRGDNYSIKNIAGRDARLFFAQGRMVPVEEYSGTATAQ
ncbi:hypothetical protein BOTBODRAFT_172794 [Botryobasidium botryosum FD-172 SS1]|uniref:CENP-C homolog n=1 Tax=Botryobasidium botryosum (strain FD-172 SS1) TaxID=930990 RepID=A0A067MLP5_BOTB1|nr:hypothetical protein BOTBODRAFT_172794 [Botryobasidium botryosum FD-172 SS1]